MSNALIEIGAEIYNGSFSLRFAPKPEDKYVPKNYDEEAEDGGFPVQFLSDSDKKIASRNVCKST